MSSSPPVENQKISARVTRAIARHPAPSQCPYCAAREIVKSYAYNRIKIFRLLAAWKKWAGEKK
ncbi:MAG: hypothetical protein HY007_02200 [Candidatus Sungbacteria bacterium]|nr:hypothetical protein [Candidatus Sungbacteria bacterium]